ncbi:hypothetical protein Tco_0396184 [Tanacetum coccineum]
MLEMQKPPKDKHGIGYTNDIASTSNTETKKLSPKKCQNALCRTDVAGSLCKRTASSDEPNRLVLTKKQTTLYRKYRKWKNIGTNILKKNNSVLIARKSALNISKSFIRNNPLILKKWHPDENLLKEDVSTVPIWVKLHGVPVTAFSEDGLSAIAIKLGTPLLLDSYTSDMCMQSWGRSSYARVMIELRADVELKDNLVVAKPKITREGHYTCNVRVEYEWKPPRCSSCKVFRYIYEEYPKNTGASEKKTMKKPSQTSRGVPVGPKMSFKPQKEYRPVPKKPNASSSGNKKKGVVNPFDVLNLVDNDVGFGTNRGTTNLVNNEATSSGSSFMNIDNDGEFASNTPIVPTGIVKSDSEVEVVFDETANLRISTSDKDGSDKGYGTNSLLEQWRDSYQDNDDYDLYDDDMYENHDLSEHLQSICDDLDITVRGRKKK